MMNLPDHQPYKTLNSMLIYDTSGLKPRVKENNPKTLVSEVNGKNPMLKLLIMKSGTLLLPHTKIYITMWLLIQT